MRFIFLFFLFLSTKSFSQCEFRLVSLTCHQQEGSFFADKIYLKASGGVDNYGNKITDTNGQQNLGSFSTGKTLNISPSGRTIKMTNLGIIEFELWDDDMYDPDDFLGKCEISCRLGKGLHSFYFNDGSSYLTLGGGIKEGALYELVVEIK